MIVNKRSLVKRVIAQDMVLFTLGWIRDVGWRNYE